MFKRSTIILLLLSLLITLTNLAYADKKKSIDNNIILGIERIAEYPNLFSGKRIGLITNATGVDKNLKSNVLILKEQTNLIAIFTPEHGFLGQVSANEKTADGYSEEFQLPIYSLYGSTRKPTSKMLENIDILVFDIQDVGVRHYTYISTMALAMQAAKENNKQFVVLDRPNPLSGKVQGPTLKPGNESFIGMYPIPLRHGMTVGELALLFNKEYNINVDLKVIPMLGWSRDMYITDTKLTWIQTSPNIPTPMSAYLYPATCMAGSAKASDGVGTTQPFEFAGMPNINAYNLARTLNSYKLPGVYFRPVVFVPKFGKFTNQNCFGVQLHVTDIRSFDPIKSGVLLVKELEKLYTGEDFWESWGGSSKVIDAHLGEDSLRNNKESLDQILVRWQQESNKFRKMANKYYLYK